MDHIGSDMTLWSVRVLQIAIRRGTGWRIERDKKDYPITLAQQKVIDLGDAAEKELQRREALEGVCYERLT